MVDIPCDYVELDCREEGKVNGRGRDAHARRGCANEQWRSHVPNAHTFTGYPDNSAKCPSSLIVVTRNMEVRKGLSEVVGY